ncbi:alpha/beta hydrolase fold domain-containing protein [Hymenobacter sp. H14-R3]|uniref:alpha/beta hydrolase fold domain-containing protein n=1 Tax=Hymenobacter sp. H14-R3 TaxID=3046308 RepID=UPI0024BAA1C3|nr:alpha/beta hydrolase fold domain-containing protein [Hymenobacter sp. H14-R3]MDJ0364038.1 alpha/beta hydrolase fold domain-containing protein [Hymenobacter sp. H14-R3]
MFQFWKSASARWAAPVAALGLLAACSSSQTTGTSSVTATSDPATAPAPADSAATSQPMAVKPSAPAPAWGTGLHPEMQAVIEQLTALSGPTPMAKLTPQEARKAPSATDAAMATMQKFSIPTPPATADTMSRVVMPGVKVRIYTPKGATGPLPVIVYYHGGGWVIANLDTYDPSVRALVEQTGAIVVSVAYRQGPENKFPTAHNDSFAAYQWTLKNAAGFRGDPARVAVAGESAGGNLACAVSLMARDKKVALPKHQLLVYPIAGYDLNTPSYLANTQTKPLNKDLMAWFFQYYLRTPADGKNPLIDLVHANLKGLPPTTLITDQYDPLMSEGKMLADNLQKAGVAVKYQNYAGVTHEFFGMAAVVPEAKEAQALASGELKNALGK